MKKPNFIEARKRTDKEVKTFNYALPEYVKELGKGKKYFIRTYGCQMNIHDSENIAAILESMSYTETKIMTEADLVILNTCAIRENAHDKVFGFLGRVKYAKEHKKDIIAAICGCMAQEETVIEKITDKYAWLDLVFGTHNINNLPELLNQVYLNKKQTVEVFSYEGDIVENMPSKRDSKYKAWVNIMLGCDKFCTYCIVPYTRGKQRSRKSSDIINEIKELISNGYQEVTLLGQNVNAYGKDLDGDFEMSDLLEKVAALGIPRIRFMTSHPWDFNDKMIGVIKNNSNIMPYVHLPVQSGSNAILKLMGRRYTKEKYLELVHKLKSEIPGLALSTDIIVGFPNETEENFKETIDLVNKCEFDFAFTFLFSPRKGTPAAQMIDDVSIEEKNSRLYDLNELVNKYANDNNQKYVGTTVNVLIEGKGENNSLIGTTETMKQVNVEGSEELIGKIVSVKIESAKTWSLNGKAL